MFSVACFIVGSSLFYGCIAGVTKQDTWIAVIIAAIVSLPIVWVFATLCEKFPGKNLIEINDIVFGKIFGKFFSVLYILFFLSIAFINSGFTSNFVVSIILPETPQIAILIILILACVYAVRKGLEVITRNSMLFFGIALATLILAILGLLNKSHLSNFQPILSLPIINYIQSTHQITMMSFSNIIVFGIIFPSLRTPSNIKKPLFGGLIIGELFMLGVVLIDIAALGPAESLVDFPSFDVIRLINIEDIITRMDFLFEGVFMMLFFFKISIVLYAVVKSIAQILNLQSYKYLAPIVGALTISIALIAFDFPTDIDDISANILPIYQTLFELILPAMTLVIASLRGFQKPKAVIE